MKKLLLPVLVSALFLSGCAPLLVGGAATGVAAVNDRRSLGTIVDDRSLQMSVASRIANIKRLTDNSHVNVTTFNGLVLLTGEAANQTVRNDIETVARETEGTLRVANHIIIGPRSSFMNRAYDSAQTSKVKTVMFDVNVAGFNPNRVKVTTEHGVTFLMGIVTQKEANAIVNVARRVSGVAQIVSLFEIDDNINNVPSNPFANEPTTYQQYHAAPQNGGR